MVLKKFFYEENSLSLILLTGLFLPAHEAFAVACADADKPLCLGECRDAKEACVYQLKVGLPPVGSCVCKKKLKQSSLDAEEAEESDSFDPLIQLLNGSEVSSVDED